MERAANRMHLRSIIVLMASVFLWPSCSKNTDDNHNQADTIPGSIQPFAFVNEVLDEESRIFFSLESIDQDTFYGGQPGEEIEQDSLIQKQDSLLLLPLSSGKYLELKDTGEMDSDTYTIYRYLGRFNTIPYYLVFSEEYESYHMILVDKDNGAQHEVYDQCVVSPKASYLVGMTTDSDEAFVNDPYFRMSFDSLSMKKINDKSQSVVIDMSKLGGQFESFPEECHLSWENEKVLLVNVIFESEGTTSECYLRLTRR